MEPDEGLEKLSDALKICAHFKDLYFEKKSQLSVYFKENPVVEWNFKSSLIFTRMDMFINQMRLIEVTLVSLANSMLQLLKVGSIPVLM